ncbi:MAG: hypothetical protein L6V93_07025 [Clostridiales bacterium]|nr:MAG: hypothetical protein L6V93_07025 [Clostridiales bacterium]
MKVRRKNIDLCIMKSKKYQNRKRERRFLPSLMRENGITESFCFAENSIVFLVTVKVKNADRTALIIIIDGINIFIAV